MLGVEKHAAEEPSGHRFLAWVIRHLDWPCGRGHQPVQKPGGYCWSFYFHATGLLLPRWILKMFAPSMMAWARHYFRHVGDDQQ